MAETTTPHPTTTVDQFADIRAIADRATARPLLLSDCEGVLKVWAESALKCVTRDKDGAITGWSEPGTFTACDLVAEVELDMGTWDPGQDVDDDQRRTDLVDLVDSRAALRVLLDRIDALEAALAASGTGGQP